MPGLVFFSSASGNTLRFVTRLEQASAGRFGKATRIPISPQDPIPDPGGVHFRIDRFEDKSVGQIRPFQGAADEASHRGAQPLAGRFGTGGDVGQDLDFLFDGGAQHFHEQLRLGREVAVDHPGGDPGYRCDRRDLRFSEPAFRDQLARRQQDSIPVVGEPFLHQGRASVNHEMSITSFFEFVFTFLNKSGIFVSRIEFYAVCRSAAAPAEPHADQETKCPSIA